MTVEVDRKKSSQQMVEATRSLSGTGDVTGKVAREVERLNMWWMASRRTQGGRRKVCELYGLLGEEAAKPRERRVKWNVHGSMI